MKPSARLANFSIALAFSFWLPGATLCAQEASPAPQQEEFYAIRAESDLVLVPLFVYDKTRVGYPATSAESACWDANALKFYKIPLSTAYFPANCDPAGIAGLTAADFYLFEDGEEVRVQSVALERWRVTVRDNVAKYDEFSRSPRAIWSTADLARDFFPFDASYFYVLAYVPTGAKATNCHDVEVKVNRPDAWVVARPKYCEGQSDSDPLNLTPLGQQMERELISETQGKTALSIQAGSFYSGNEKDRIDITLEFPWETVHTDRVQPKFPWRPLKGQEVGLWTYHQVAVLVIASAEDGSFAARVSDLAIASPHWPMPYRGWRLNTGSGDSRIALIPSRYEAQFDLPPGDYDLQVVISDGTDFGKAETPLAVEKYDGEHLGLSSVILCKRFRDAAVAVQEAAAANLAPQYVPLVSKGIRVTPSGDTRFKKGEPLIPYFETYEPLLTSAPATKVQAHFRVIEAKTGQVRDDFTVDAQSCVQPGKTVIPMTREVLTDKMPKGAYRLEVQATDSAGRSTPWRTADFTVE